MDHRLHHSPAEHQGQPTPIAPRGKVGGGIRRGAVVFSAVDSNSYHDAAIKGAEQERLDRRYPRLYR